MQRVENHPNFPSHQCKISTTAEHTHKFIAPAVIRDALSRFTLLCLQTRRSLTCFK